jgi:AraC family transcriptional regulator
MTGLNRAPHSEIELEISELIQLLNRALAPEEEVDRQVIIYNGLKLCALLLSQQQTLEVETVCPKLLPAWKEKKAKELISSKLSDHVPISAIAKECALSRSHFSRAFKQNTGISPKEWVINERVRRAKELLLDEVMPIAQIGIECGFSDQSHFTRIFSKYVGMTPRKWRGQNLADAHRTTDTLEHC